VFSNNCTPLHLFLKKAHLQIVEYFVNHGADVISHDIQGNIPLHYSAYNGHHNIFQYLVNNGADIHERNLDGFYVWIY